LAQQLGLSSRAIEKNIAQLKADGWLKRIGAAKGGYWQVGAVREPPVQRSRTARTTFANRPYGKAVCKFGQQVADLIVSIDGLIIEV
jgi:DNA-binding Lrp family transcriptional regulator